MGKPCDVLIDCHTKKFNSGHLLDNTSIKVKLTVYLSVSCICVNLGSLRCLRLAMTAARLGCIQSSLPVMLKAWGRWCWDCSQQPSPTWSCIDHRGQCRWSLPSGGSDLLCIVDVIWPLSRLQKWGFKSINSLGQFYSKSLITALAFLKTSDLLGPTTMSVSSAYIYNKVSICGAIDNIVYI